MDTWRLLITPPKRGAWNMALDEAILEHIGRGDSPPTLRLYAWEPACLSLGQAQPFTDVDIVRLQERGWDVVRRATGGRAILHTDELTYSVIAPAHEPCVAGSVPESYQRLAQALVLGVRNLGLSVEIESNAAQVPAAPKTNAVCFEVPSTYEITVKRRKLIGSAQARRRDGVLQHGSLPLSGNLARICQVLAFENETARADASERLLRRAATIESALGRAISWDTAAGAFIRAFEAQLDLTLERGKLSKSESERTDQLVNEKYDHPSWTERIQPVRSLPDVVYEDRVGKAERSKELQ